MTVSNSISAGEALGTAILGYAVVFLGIALLLIVVQITGKLMNRKKAPEAAPAPALKPEPSLVTAPVPEAPGAAGALKLYDTDPKDAAMVMAIVADTLDKPLNELRFISIREVREDEV